DADHDAGLAIAGDTDDCDHARADLLLAVIGKALEILHLDALDRTRHQLDVADLAHAGGARRRSVSGSAAQRQLLARIRQIALKLLALLDQRGDPGWHVLKRGAQLRRR